MRPFSTVGVQSALYRTSPLGPSSVFVTGHALVLAITSAVPSQETSPTRPFTCKTGGAVDAPSAPRPTGCRSSSADRPWHISRSHRGPTRACCAIPAYRRSGRCLRESPGKPSSSGWASTVRSSFGPRLLALSSMVGTSSARVMSQNPNFDLFSSFSKRRRAQAAGDAVQTGAAEKTKRPAFREVVLTAKVTAGVGEDWKTIEKTWSAPYSSK